MFFKRKRYILINVDEDEEVDILRKPISKSEVKAAIAEGELEPATYRLIMRVEGERDKTVWTMKHLSPEEIAEKSREKALAVLEKDAREIKERVEQHKRLRQKINEMYGIDTSDMITIPDDLTISSALHKATAESLYVTIRKNPERVTNNFFSLMESVTKLVSAGANLVAESAMRHRKRQASSVKKVVKQEGDKKVVEFEKEKEEK